MLFTLSVQSAALATEFGPRLAWARSLPYRSKRIAIRRSQDRTLACMSATATVSPKSIWMAVEVTGARSNGHNSLSSGRITYWSVPLASLDVATDVTPIRVAPCTSPSAHVRESA
eukprot:scaffold175_cov414-Prasinococcus_capsulatus_cf.AAC.39